MFRKSIFIMLFVCLLASSNYVLAYSWGPNNSWAGTIDRDWLNPGNWYDTNFVPDISIHALVPSNNDGPIIDGDASCMYLNIEPWSQGRSYTEWGVDMNSGTLDCNYGIAIGAQQDFSIADGGIPTFTVHGGTVRQLLSSGDGVLIGGGGSGYGPTFGRLYMYGGTLTSSRIELRYGEINLYGGTLKCTGDANFVVYQNRSENKINVNGGTLQLAGNWTTTSDPNLPGLINAGRIVCMRGGTLGTPTYDAGTNYTTLTGTSDFNLAWNPIPAMNAPNAHYYHADGNYITLTWNRGEPNIVQHDVYFGTSAASVTNATTASPEFKHSFTDANMGDPCSWTISGFNFVKGTFYYWRVDETQQTGDTTFVVKKGQTWAFRTFDGKAYNPKPISSTTGLSEPLQLSWAPSEFAAYHNVFFGTSSANANGASTAATDGRYRGSVSSPAYPLVRLLEKGANLPGASYTLTPGVTYYWRVDEVNGTSVVKGDVWNFTAAGYVNIDDFEDYNTTVDMNSVWLTVYDNNCPSAGGHMDLTPGAISLTTGSTGKYMRYTYINSGGRGIYYSEIKRPYTGGTSFTGGGVLTPALAALRVDYLGTSLNSVDPDFDRMYIAIEDTEGNVAVYLNPDPSASAVTSWTSWFAALKDINAMGMPKPVRLADVNGFCIGFGKRCLTSIGDEPPFPGDGNVMFDNIRLYAQTCNLTFAHTTGGLTADLDNDCDVDINDMDAFANDWLAHAEDRTFAVTPPAAPVLWFKFNETGEVSIAQDSGTGDANNYDGTVVGWTTKNWKPTSRGNTGNTGCLYLPSGGNSSVSIDVASLNFMSDANHSGPDGGGITFSTWINADLTAPDFGGWLYGFIVVKDASGNDAVEIACPHHWSRNDWSANNAWVGWVKNGNPSFSLGPSAPPVNFGGRWNHWAFVKAPHTLSWYCNGTLLRQEADTDANIGDPNIYGKLFTVPVSAFTIGLGGFGGNWAGYIDDFQVYDHALSQAEIDYLATDGTGTLLIPLVTSSNLKSSGNPHTETIDFKDLAVMCQQFRQQVLWP